jgi:hypothetical protein
MMPLVGIHPSVSVPTVTDLDAVGTRREAEPVVKRLETTLEFGVEFDAEGARRIDAASRPDPEISIRMKRQRKVAVLVVR